VRALVLLIPLAAGFGAAVLVSRLLGHPDGVGDKIVFWAAVIGTSIVAVIITDWQARRLLPLAALLRLSLVFPDKAPSRFAVALRAGSVGQLRERAAAVADTPEAAEAARQILILAGALARHDRTTRGHSERVRAYTDLLAEELGLSTYDADRLRWSALLHDVGKLAVDHDVLNKHDSLDAAEWEALHRHPEEGARIAKPLRTWLGPWALAIAQHHERWDGSGYPRGLAGKKISRAARIVAVADAFDVMTAARSYKRPMRAEAARMELAECAERDFDPEVVRAFLDISLGRVRWALGFGALLAVPLMPRQATQSARNATTAGVAAAAALAVGLLPLQATPATQVLGESFTRQPPGATSTTVPSSTPQPSVSDALSPPGTAPTTTVIAPPFVPVTTTTSTTVPSAPGTQAQAAPALTPTAPTATTTTTATPAPQPRVAVNDVVASTVTAPIRIDVLANDSEPGGTLVPKSVSIVTAPLHGKAKPDKDGRVHYDPDGHYVGPDSFTYSVCDTAGQCFTALVTLTVDRH
jgi:putative nucleotidyltransferase with HDIG domain